MGSISLAAEVANMEVLELTNQPLSFEDDLLDRIVFFFFLYN